MKVIPRRGSRVYFRHQVSKSSRSMGETWGLRFVTLVLLIWASSLIIGFEASLTILTILGFAAAAVGLRQPVVGLFGIGLLATMDAPMRHFLSVGGFFRWNTLNYWLLIAMVINVSFLIRLNDPHSRILQIYFGLLAVQLLISPLLMDGIHDLLSIVTMFGLLVYFAKAAEDHHAWYWLGLVSGVLAATGGLVFYILQENLIEINMNAWATFLTTSLLMICLSSVFSKNQPRRWFILFIVAVVNSAWVFLSGSRGNMIIALCCLFYLILMMRGLSWGTFALILAIILGYSLSISFIDQQAFALHRLDKLFDLTISLESRTSGRSTIAYLGWQIFLDNPFGIGTGAFRAVFPGYENPFLSPSGPGTPAHSAWVKTLAENGIPGIIVLAIYVCSFAFVGLRKGQKELAMLGMFVTLIISVTFLSMEFQNKGIWFLAAGTTVLMQRENIIRHLKRGRWRKFTTNNRATGATRYGRTGVVRRD
jgi:hypothetical protein